MPPKVLAAWDAAAAAVEATLRPALGARLLTGDPAPGDAVLEVLVRPDEPWIASWRRHRIEQGPRPGGAWALAVPEDAPSRGYGLLEEAVAWSGARLRKGDVAVQLGGAPGGLTAALLDRGLRPTVVDPHPLSLPQRFGKAPPTHHARRLDDLPREALPDAARWLVFDLSVGAERATAGLIRLAKRWRGPLKGALGVLHLPAWDDVERLPALLEALRAAGLPHAAAASLPSCRQELVLVAQTEPWRGAAA